MKLFKSTNTTPIDSLPQGKARLSVGGKDVENIWVARDEINKKMYLLNHALGFYPYPSWGSEWPLSDSIDIEKARGANISETILILHPKTYDFLKNSIVNDVFNLEEFNKNSENINK